MAESHYNPLLPGVVRDLAEKGLLVESEGARCVFPPGYANRAGDPLPLIVQNSVGGYTYAATDLAAVRDRVDRLKAQLLLYVVGLPQADHLAMVFTTARLAGWLPDATQAVHVGFGNVLGPDGKMFRTRQGGTVKLDELLDEAVERAKAVIERRGEEAGKAQADELSADEFEGVARAVGLGAVKYADLSTDRTRVTTGSTGTECFPLTAIPAPTFSTRTPGFAVSFGGRPRKASRCLPPLVWPASLASTKSGSSVSGSWVSVTQCPPLWPPIALTSCAATFSNLRAPSPPSMSAVRSCARPTPKREPPGWSYARLPQRSLKRGSTCWVLTLRRGCEV